MAFPDFVSYATIRHPVHGIGYWFSEQSLLLSLSGWWGLHHSCRPTTTEAVAAFELDCVVTKIAELVEQTDDILFHTIIIMC